MENPEFYLASTEGYGLEEPRECYTIKRLRSESRNDLMLVHVAPPLVGQRYGLGGEDLDVLIIATRYEGDSLFPIKSWPVYVHIARPLVSDPERREALSESEFASIAWAELYRTREDARLKRM